MSFRSLLFVPGDRPERFAKAAASGADAIILDLEDAVHPDRKKQARAAICEYLAVPRGIPCFVRLNPLESAFIKDDLGIVSSRPDGLVLPKVEGPSCIEAWLERLGSDAPPLLPIATETPAGVFALGQYKPVSQHLAGLTWGAEDLPAAMGAQSREAGGELTFTYQMIRSFTALGAHAAGVAAIDTVYPDIGNLEGLANYVAAARREGFTGMMALHPAQIPIINAGFVPSSQDAERAQRIVDAFAANPGVGALMMDGSMVDAPHLKQAIATLERFNRFAARLPGEQAPAAGFSESRQSD